MHLNSELIFKKYALPLFMNHSKVLEIGPAGIPSVYQKIVNNASITWHTIDFAETTFINASSDSLTYIINKPYSFPLPDEMYDIILSGQVIEHVPKPWVWIKELKRLAKNRGIIITINPISWPYHEAPIDCWRIFPAGIEALADDAGLDILLNRFESLELELLRKKDKSIRFIPGKSFSETYDLKTLDRYIFWTKFLHFIPMLNKQLLPPVEVAFDCISVLSKTK